MAGQDSREHKRRAAFHPDKVAALHDAQDMSKLLYQQFKRQTDLHMTPHEYASQMLRIWIVAFNLTK